jgi:hypothetical protein
MELANLLPFVPLAALVFVPLAREYGEFRREWGLSRGSALLTTLLILPALGLGLALALPLAPEPALQWTATVVVTLAAYSLGVAAVRPRAASEARRESA